VRNDEEMSRIWEVAKLLWNSDISAAHTMITSAGACRLLPFLLFSLPEVYPCGCPDDFYVCMISLA
jgi:hypothetical protein